MRRRRPSWFYTQLSEQGQLGRIWVACMFFSIVAVTGTYSFAEDTGNLEQTVPLIDHIMPESLDDVTPGDIVLIHGIITTSDIPADFASELSFWPAIRVRRELDQWRGYQRGGPWQNISSVDWVAPQAQIGPWRISADTLLFVRSGNRPAKALMEYKLPDMLKATDIESDDTEIVYRWHDTKYRLQYQIWPANMPYTVVARLSATGELTPFHIDPAGKIWMAIVTPGMLADAAVSRSSMLFKKALVLAGVGIAALTFWWLVSLTFDFGRFGKTVLTGIFVGPLAVAIQPPVIYQEGSFYLATLVPAICLVWMTIYRIYHWWRHE